MGIAHGGQLIVSAAALDMARDGLPAGLGLRDLGWHRLRDLTSPEHVWQVAGDAMTTEFPPLRSLDGFRGNLPCEHVLAAAASLVHEVTGAAPNVVVVATSREPLHLPGEQVWTVPTLSVDDVAVDLFVERASAVTRGFAPGPAELEAIKTVCRRLDGMPPAIELAAARMRSLTAIELAARLDQRFRLLGITGRGVVEGRHASLPHRGCRTVPRWPKKHWPSDAEPATFSRFVGPFRRSA